MLIFYYIYVPSINPSPPPPQKKKQNKTQLCFKKIVITRYYKKLSNLFVLRGLQSTGKDNFIRYVFRIERDMYTISRNTSNTLGAYKSVVRLCLSSGRDQKRRRKFIYDILHYPVQLRIRFGHRAPHTSRSTGTGTNDPCGSIVIGTIETVMKTRTEFDDNIVHSARNAYHTTTAFGAHDALSRTRNVMVN